MPEMGEEFVKECSDKQKIDAPSAEQLRSGKFNNPSENVKCFIKCLLDKGGFLKDGKFVDAKVKDFYSKSPKKDAIFTTYDGCKNLKGSSECDTAFMIKQCMTKGVMAANS